MALKSQSGGHQPGTGHSPSNSMIADFQPNIHDYVTGHIPEAFNLSRRSLMDDDNSGHL